MEKYTKPSVDKVRIQSRGGAGKRTNCNGANARKMPEANFTKK